MSKKTIWYCDYCGSDDVEEKCWIKINDSKNIDGHLWYQYQGDTGIEHFHCNECGEECDITDIKPKEEE